MYRRRSRAVQQDERGKFVKGNCAALGSKGGGNWFRLINSPEELWQHFLDYKKALEDEPLKEERIGFSKDGVQRAEVSKMRAMSIEGLCRHIGVTSNHFRKWEKERDDLKDTIAAIRDAMFEQKFEGAAAGLLKEGIIMRDLGLADNLNQNLLPPPPPPVAAASIANRTHPDCSPEEIEALYAAGLEPPLYSQSQIDSGMPYVSPLMKTVNG